MNLLSHKNPDVLKLREEISNESIKDCEKYQYLVDELNKKERKYAKVLYLK